MAKNLKIKQIVFYKNQKTVFYARSEFFVIFIAFSDFTAFQIVKINFSRSISLRIVFRNQRARKEGVWSFCDKRDILKVEERARGVVPRT